MYQYVLIYNTLLVFHHSAYKYVRVRTRTYTYRLIWSEFQKDASRFQPRDLLHTFCRSYHCTKDVQTRTSTPGYISIVQHWIYIVFNSYCPCTWRLISDRRLSRWAPAPCHDIARQSLRLDLDLPKVQLRSQATWRFWSHLLATASVGRPEWVPPCLPRQPLRCKPLPGCLPLQCLLQILVTAPDYSGCSSLSPMDLSSSSDSELQGPHISELGPCTSHKTRFDAIAKYNTITVGL